VALHSANTLLAFYNVHPYFYFAAVRVTFFQFTFFKTDKLV